MSCFFASSILGWRIRCSNLYDYTLMDYTLAEGFIECYFAIYL